MEKTNENRLYLKVPEFNDLWFRKKLLGDPYTMEFNKGYDINTQNYNYNTGTIDFDETMWADWYDKWVKDTNKSYYAYVVRTVDNEYIGEVSYKKNLDKGYETNVLLTSSARGFNYSYDALNLLAKEAFEEKGINSLSDTIPERLYDKIKVFKEAGYKKIGYSKYDIKKFGISEKMLEVTYTKDEYLKKNNNSLTSKVKSFFTKY